MDTGAIKDIMYGGISELIRNRRYFYHSAVGSEYCHFTPEGEIALHKFITQMSVNMFKAEQVELDRRAKDMVLRGLKGETV